MKSHYHIPPRPIIWQDDLHNNHSNMLAWSLLPKGRLPLSMRHLGHNGKLTITAAITTELTLT
jgi:hypothetical protein